MLLSKSMFGKSYLAFLLDVSIRLAIVLFFTSYDKQLLTLLLLSGMLNNLTKLIIRGAFSSLIVQYSVDYPNSITNQNLFNFSISFSVFISLCIGIPFIYFYYTIFSDYKLIETIFLAPLFLISTSMSFLALRYKGTGNFMYYYILENSFFSLGFFSLTLITQYFSLFAYLIFTFGIIFLQLFFSFKKMFSYSYFIRRAFVVAYIKNIQVTLRRGLRFLFFKGKGLVLPLFLNDDTLPFILLIERFLQFSTSVTGPIDNYLHRKMHSNAFTWKNILRTISLKVTIALLVQSATTSVLIWYFPNEFTTLSTESIVYLAVVMITGIVLPVETVCSLYLEANGRSKINIQIYLIAASFSIFLLLIFGLNLESFSVAILAFVLTTVLFQLRYNWQGQQ